MYTKMSKTTSILDKLVQSFYLYSSELNLDRESAENFTWDLQKQFLEMTVHNEVLLKYPVRKTFSRYFFKKLINNLQQYQEVHDNIFSFLCTVMSDDDEKYCHRHFVVKNDLNKIISMRETNNLVVNGTTGLRTWEAGVILADWALSNREVFEDKNILELGSGVGFTGIAIAKECKVKSICMTDCHAEVIKTLCENVEINFPTWKKLAGENGNHYSNEETSIDVKLYDWNNADKVPSEEFPDVIIGADIVYDPSIIPLLCKVFQTFFAMNSNVVIYVQSAIRNKETYQCFRKLLDTEGLQYDEIYQDKPVHFVWDNTVKKSLLKIYMKS